jgi:hypothetical protein
MRDALATLAEKFDQWRAGAMSCDELHNAVHEYHDGIGREIWKRYATNRPEMPLAHAVAAGFVERDSLPPEVLDRINSTIEMFEELLQQK